MSEYKGANNTNTLQGNTKATYGRKIVNATKFLKLKKLLGDYYADKVKSTK